MVALSDDPDELVLEYQKTGDIAVRDRLLERLKPSINFSLNRFTGGSSDPILKAKAYARTISGLKNFNPGSGTSIKTYVVNNLQPLARERRALSSPTRLPERSQLDMWKIDRAEAEFADEHGRDPDIDELADRTGLSVRRIHKVRASKFSAPQEFTAEFESVTPEGESPDRQAEAMEYLYASASPIDKKILQYQLGYGGKPILGVRELAGTLKISPSSVSTRAKSLMDQVQQITSILER